MDGKYAMLVLLADTAPAWERNAVSSIPIYMGDFDVQSNTNSIMNESCMFELNSGEEARKATFFSGSPMVNTGSTMKVWLSGDVAEESDYISLRIAGQELVKLRDSATRRQDDILDKGRAQK